MRRVGLGGVGWGGVGLVRGGGDEGSDGSDGERGGEGDEGIQFVEQTLLPVDPGGGCYKMIEIFGSFPTVLCRQRITIFVI